MRAREQHFERIGHGKSQGMEFVDSVVLGGYRCLPWTNTDDVYIELTNAYGYLRNRRKRVV